MWLSNYSSLYIKQRREMLELLGFETRNKYEIQTENGVSVGFAAEQSKGFWGALGRYILGHWRTFEIHIFDQNKNLKLKALHPFRFLFQRFEIFDETGKYLGALQQRFGIVYKKFDIEDSRGHILLKMKSGLFSIWTFPVFRSDRRVAVIEKKWGGILKEAFLDADSFRLSFEPMAQFSESEKALVLAGALFVDLQYFEKRASN